MFRFFNYYRLLGIILFLLGLELTFRTGDITILKYIGLFLMFVGGYDIITGRSMKVFTAVKTPLIKKSINSEVAKDESEVNSKDSFNINKSLFSKFFKINTIIGVATLAIAIIFFMSSGFIAKKYFNYSEVKHDFNYSSALTTDVPTTSTSVVTFKYCSKLLLNEKVILKVNSLESNTKNTSLNISIENNGPSDIQLFGSNKFELVDESGNHFKFKLEDSIGIYTSADKSTTTDYRLVFDPLSNPSKSISFKGQIWTLNGGIQNLPFNINIK